ncbi:MAG TPA: tetratricopeptide repeat protein, partial [bacterium]|nr:tetratricopeptide repeat protein [bacterium]
MKIIKKIFNSVFTIVLIAIMTVMIMTCGLSAFDSSAVIIKTKSAFSGYLKKQFNQKNYEDAVEIINAYRTSFFSGTEREYFILFTSYLNTNRFRQLIDEYNSISEEFIAKKEFTDMLEAANAGLNQQIFMEKIEKIKNSYYKAESYYAARNYEEAKKLYRESLDILPSSNIYETTRSKERLKQIETDILNVKINNFKADISKSESPESLNAVLKKYFVELKNNNDSGAERIFFFEKLLEYFKTADLNKLNSDYDFYKNHLAPESKRRLLYALIKRFLEEGNNEYFDKHIEEIKKDGSASDSKEVKELLSLRKQNTLKSSIKIILITAIGVLLVLSFVFKKKIFYFILLFKTRYYESAGDNENLAGIYYSLLNLKPDDAITLKLLEILLEKKMLDEQAIGVYKRLENKKLLSFKTAVRILKTLIKNNLTEESRQLIITAKKQYASENEILELLLCELDLYSRTGDNEKKIITLEEMLRLKFDNSHLEQLAVLYCEKNNSKSAYLYLKQWLKQQPKSIEKIIEFTEKLAGKYENNTKFLDFLGVLYRKTGQIIKAIKIYEELLNKHKSKLPAYSALFDLYQKTEDSDKIISVSEEIIKLRTDNFEDKLFLSQMYFKIKKYDKAVELLAELILLDANSLRINLLLSDVAGHYA